MNKLMHVMQEQIDAYNANFDFWGTWIGHSSHSSRLNYMCKIECLHVPQPVILR